MKLAEYYKNGFAKVLIYMLKAGSKQVVWLHINLLIPSCFYLILGKQNKLSL